MPLQTVTDIGEDGSCRPMKKLGVVAKAVTVVTGSTDRQGMARTQRDVKNGKTPGTVWTVVLEKLILDLVVGGRT